MPQIDMKIKNIAAFIINFNLRKQTKALDINVNCLPDL